MSAAEAERRAGGGWLGRLRSGLSRSSDRIAGGVAALLSRPGRRLDAETLEELEDLLITADLGAAAAARLAAGLSRRRFDTNGGGGADATAVREALAEDIAAILAPVAAPLPEDPAVRPRIVLVCGVNGGGKTTTIGKLARLWTGQGKTVWLAAGDTFRAAAIEQLQVWGERAGAHTVAPAPGTDPAAVAFDAADRAARAGADALLIDTAGRLQNRTELMDELAKVARAVRKRIPDAPHDRLLVLDGTVGQNAHAQLRAFRETVDITGLVVTKLDGSARGGVVVALAEEFGLPIHAVGVGEGLDDLRPFVARDFARGLMGLD